MSFKDKYKKFENKFRKQRDKVLGSEVGGALSDGVRKIGKQELLKKGGIKGLAGKHGKKGIAATIILAGAYYAVDPIGATAILMSLFG